MRCLLRNKIELYYAVFDGKVENLDEYGNRTGEYTLIYKPLQKAFANISGAKGETQTRQFGEDESYDKVIVFEKDVVPIDEYSILWVDVVPEIDAMGIPQTPHDYVVNRVAKSLNSTQVAIKKVNVRG